MAATLSSPFVSAFLDGNPKQLFINGVWVENASGATFETVNPSTGEVLAEIAEGDATDVDRAVAAASGAFVGPWSRFTPQERQNVLLRLADLVEEHWEELRLLEILEMGSPHGASLSHGSQHTAETLRYYAGWVTKIHGETVPNSVEGRSVFTYTLKEPVGVVGAIIPWNAPMTSIVWKIGPALATGCTVVLKPAEEASLTALRFGELIQELDLPAGVFNIVTGFGEVAGAALTGHPNVDKIAFTGSTNTGQVILRSAASNLKRVSLELGGKSPDIVFADSDLERAIPGAAMGVFGNSGQICCAGTRLFVERSIYKEFASGIAEFAKSLRVGNSLDPATEIGPLVSRAQLDRVTGYLSAGKEEGAQLLAGGARLTTGDLANGYFVPPTVFADVSDEMSIARDEIFGPVASVMPFDTIDEVVARSNNTHFGLGGGVWTRDVSKAHRLARELRTGVVWVNAYSLFDPAMPFGGYKMSGWGNELSGHALDEYLNIKAVWIDDTP